MSRKARVTAGVAALVAGAAALAGCSATKSGSSTTASGTPIQGGVVRVAQVSGTQPTAIWPFYTPQQNSAQNAGLDGELYRPLYFVGSNDTISVDYTKSLGEAPVWSNNGKTVSVTLKSLKWSNGETTTAQDALFWLNILHAEKANYADYTPPIASIGADYIPDNVVSASASGQTLTLNLDKAYNQTWFQENELALINPMPMAWDLTSATTKGTCSTGTYGAAATDTACTADWKYLSPLSGDGSTWATDPIWQIVDGPYKLKSFNNTSYDWSLVPNPDYSGTDKSHLSEIDYVTYTSDTAAYAAEKAGATDKGSVQVGIIPSQDLPTYNASNIQTGNPLAKDGYYLGYPTDIDLMSYYYLNDANKADGALFKQAYFIKALQDTVDQQGIISGIAKGWGYPTNSLIPNYPSGNYLSPTLKTYTATFSVSAAKALLAANGWNTATTPATCTKPGTAAGECGAGVTAGQKAEFSFMYGTGSQGVLTEVQDLASDAGQAGIKIDLNGQQYSAISNYMVACSASNPSGCQWQAIQYGSWIYSADPTGDGLLATGVGNNIGSYSDPTLDRLIYNTTTQSGNSAMAAYEDYTLTHAIPLIFTPNFSNTRTPPAVANNLVIGKGNAFGYFDDEDWYYTSNK
jgi:peptide/nickel transport system substrate-binding protein